MADRFDKQALAIVNGAGRDDTPLLAAILRAADANAREIVREELARPAPSEDARGPAAAQSPETGSNRLVLGNFVVGDNDGVCFACKSGAHPHCLHSACSCRGVEHDAAARGPGINTSRPLYEGTEDRRGLYEAPAGEPRIEWATFRDGVEVARGSEPTPQDPPRKSAEPDDPLELAYWRFDSLRKRKGMPMAERDAFKSAVRGMPQCAPAGEPRDLTAAQWRAVESKTGGWYVTAAPADWKPDPLASYACVGVWTDRGVTSREVAERIAADHNALLAARPVAPSPDLTERLAEALRESLKSRKPVPLTASVDEGPERVEGWMCMDCQVTGGSVDEIEHADGCAYVRDVALLAVLASPARGVTAAPVEARDLLREFDDLARHYPRKEVGRAMRLRAKIAGFLASLRARTPSQPAPQSCANCNSKIGDCGDDFANCCPHPLGVSEQAGCPGCGAKEYGPQRGAAHLDLNDDPASDLLARMAAALRMARNESSFGVLPSEETRRRWSALIAENDALSPAAPPEDIDAAIEAVRFDLTDTSGTRRMIECDEAKLRALLGACDLRAANVGGGR